MPAAAKASRIGLTELDIRRVLAAETPEDPRARDFLGASHGQLDIHLSMLGDWPAAGRHFQSWPLREDRRGTS